MRCPNCGYGLENRFTVSDGNGNRRVDCPCGQVSQIPADGGKAVPLVNLAWLPRSF